MQDCRMSDMEQAAGLTRPFVISTRLVMPPGPPLGENASASNSPSSITCDKTALAFHGWQITDLASGAGRL